MTGRPLMECNDSSYMLSSGPCTTLQLSHAYSYMTYEIVTHRSGEIMNCRYTAWDVPVMAAAADYTGWDRLRNDRLPDR